MTIDFSSLTPDRVLDAVEDVYLLHHHPGWDPPPFWSTELNELKTQLRVIKGEEEIS